MFEDGLRYQESRMATDEEFRKDLAAVSISSQKASGKGGPVLAYEDGMLYTDPGEGHSMVVGDTGSGKTQKVILPLIYSSILSGESMFIIDPKGELMRRTEGLLRAEGYGVYGLNFRRPRESPDKWNPFDRIEKLYTAGREKEAQHYQNDTIQRLFNSRHGGDKDRYWNEAAGMFAEGSLELCQHLGRKISVANMMKLRYEEIPNGKMEQTYRQLPKDSNVYRKLSVYFNLTAENTKSCILSTYDQLMRHFNASENLTDMLSKSTFDMAEAAVKKTAIFLIVPDEKTTYHFLASLFTSQLYEVLLGCAENYMGRLPVRMNFILEEFCNMPKIDDIGPMLTAARSRNIRFHIVCQSYSQLLERYGERMGKTLIDNCSNLIYLHSREIDFLDYLSRLAGVNEFGRPLLSTSRLQRLSKDEAVIFHNRCYPCISTGLPYMYQYPVYKKYMSDDIISLIARKNSIRVRGNTQDI